MESFIKSVLIDLKNKGYKIQDLHFILPSKRASTFLKYELASIISQPVFSPQILSIEEFVEVLSGLKGISNAELLFKLYETYRTLTHVSETESFESFSKWAQILLQDFNEIDRYLIEPDKIFEYLSAIKELDHWSFEIQQTDLIKAHLKFWKNLKLYYQKFTESLLEDSQGYQGLIYREAAHNLEHYIENTTNKKLVFLGFNALNESESIIIQELLQTDLALIYWDIDQVFIEDDIHDAGLFTRQHRKSWNYFKKNRFNWVTNAYNQSKNIRAIGIPKLVGQAKYIGQLLEEIQLKNNQLSNTAVVLGEENLLIPLLNSIPNSIGQLNVTMGLPLKYIPLSSLFELLFSIHKNSLAKLYYKDVINIISHPFIYRLFDKDLDNSSSRIINHIQKNNIVYLTNEDLKRKVDDSLHNLIDILFKSWGNNANTAIKNCTSLIAILKEHLIQEKQNNSLDLEYLYCFHTLFNQLSKLNGNFKHLKSCEALYTVYKELLTSETLDFRGEPLEGLQIMGMLESRVLEYETVIISSVNEGILPSGKTNNSFIPFDVKIENGLPTFKEKDAVYTYHFYRLLQRAKNVYLLYNTEVDALKGGERSRFITQLEIEGIHQIKHYIASFNVPILEKTLKQIPKTPSIIDQLKLSANKGFSPSSLTNYMRNPIDFYCDKVLGLREFEDVEENIAANTLGSVIHNTLEDFYKPLEGEFLTEDYLKTVKSKIEITVTKHFKDLYKDGDFTKGRNLIIFEIAKRYISNFLNSEIQALSNGNTIKIIAIEADEKIELKMNKIDFPLYLTGKVDRIDQFNGITRIIDYKSGKVEQNKVEIVNWEDITTDYDKYSKSFQVLSYAYMMYQKNKIQLPAEAGIISFKNLNSGFLKFSKKESTYSRTKNQLITEDTILNFEVELKKLILEILNPKIDFIEKELDS